jgi:hypothetical protein
MSSPRVYPARADAVLDRPLSRWLWLVKWLLAIPHYICLAVLWVAFCVLSVVAFFAILFTGRYPRAIFDFNVGVLRWAWRVAYYGSAGFGTDRYPPFTLADVPDYPAHFDVDYPQRLSRGLVLVKWWLLAIPHYIVVGILVGGGAWASSADRNGDWPAAWGSGGLVGILALVAAVILLVRGSYPEPLFDVVLGLDRWVLRVAAYSGLMTDEYPPFRLDLGGTDPGTLARDGATAPPGPESGTASLTASGTGAAPAPGARTHPAWDAGRVTLVVVGSFFALFATGLLAAGAALGGADRFGRDGGYLTSPAATLVTSGQAVTTDGILLEADGPRWALPDRTLGTVRIRVTGQEPGVPVFVGIARTADADRYLAGSDHATVRSIDRNRVRYVEHTGDATLAAPTTQTFWAASATGSGRQNLTWTARAGDWTVVVLNADAAPGVDVRADVAATVPALGALALGLLAGGFAFLAVGVLLVVVAVRWAGGSARPPALATASAGRADDRSSVG